MADRNHLILTAVGPDQIGLVEKISEFIARHGCNIEDSKMAVFCGEFALVILISGDSGNLHKIANHYRELEIETGLAISIKTPTSRKHRQSDKRYFEQLRHQHRIHGNQNLRCAGERHTDLPLGGRNCGSDEDQHQ